MLIRQDGVSAVMQSMRRDGIREKIQKDASVKCTTFKYTKINKLMKERN